MGSIMASVVCLALSHTEMTETFDRTLWYLNLIFAIIFAAEAILKVVALGLMPYLRDRWNLFDCFVATSSVVNMAIDLLSTNDMKVGNLLKVLRIVRIFRLVPKVCVTTSASFLAEIRLGSPRK